MAEAPAITQPPLTLPKRVLQLNVKDEMLACIDLVEVERVFPLVQVQMVPGGPDYLVGLMNLHGTTIPLVDLALRLGLGHPPPYDLNSPIVLCRTGDLCGGLLVQSVGNLMETSATEVQMAEEFTHGQLLVRATVSTKTGLSLLLDTARILRIDMSAILAQQEDLSAATREQVEGP